MIGPVHLMFEIESRKNSTQRSVLIFVDYKMTLQPFLLTKTTRGEHFTLSKTNEVKFLVNNLFLTYR